MKIQIVCRGLAREGLGHLFRSMTFAATAAQHHSVEMVAIVEPHLEDVFARFDLPVIISHDEKSIMPHIRRFEPTVLVLDLLSFDANLLKQIATLVKMTVSLSPIFDNMSLIDMVFTRGTIPNISHCTEVFSGLQYAIFGNHCKPISDKAYENAVAEPTLPVAVSMGGTDAPNRTLAVLEAMSQIKEPCAIWVLLGEGYAHSYDALVGMLAHDRRHEIILAKTNRSMWQVMRNCAVAILAGGLTTLEAVYAGLPTLNFDATKKQRNLNQELVNRNACINCGTFDKESFGQMTALMYHLIRNRDALRDIHNNTKGILDNQGSMRVLATIEQHLNNNSH